VNESGYLDVLDEAAERGTPRGADDVFVAASASAARPGAGERGTSRWRVAVVAAAVVLLVGTGIVATRRGGDLRVTTAPTVPTADPGSGTTSSMEWDCVSLSVWEVVDGRAPTDVLVVVGRLGAPGPWTPDSRFGDSLLRRTWAFAPWATAIPAGRSAAPTTPVTAVAQTRARGCGPEVELHEGDVIVSAAGRSAPGEQPPGIASSPASVLFVVRADGSPPDDPAALTDPATRVRSGDGAPVCHLDPCTWPEVVTEIGDPARRPGPRIRGTLRMTGGPYPGIDRGIAGTVEVRDQAGEVQTVATDADGRFEVRVRNGRYEMRGTSPAVDAGQARCIVPDTVTVTAGRDVVVDVLCQIS
jgi:hypothetical protein